MTTNPSQDAMFVFQNVLFDIPTAIRLDFIPDKLRDDKWHYSGLQSKVYYRYKDRSFEETDPKKKSQEKESTVKSKIFPLQKEDVPKEKDIKGQYALTYFISNDFRSNKIKLISRESPYLCAYLIAQWDNNDTITKEIKTNLRKLV